MLIEVPVAKGRPYVDTPPTPASAATKSVAVGSTERGAEEASAKPAMDPPRIRTATAAKAACRNGDAFEAPAGRPRRGEVARCGCPWLGAHTRAGSCS